MTDALPHDPILFSFRRCPYAIRARLALNSCNIPYHTIEVDLKNKPEALTMLSPKGTVPVLYFAQTSKIFTQSLDIVKWAASTHCPPSWLSLQTTFQDARTQTTLHAIEELIPLINALKFVPPKDLSLSQASLVTQSKGILHRLEQILLQQDPRFLLHKPSALDTIVLPHIRQWHNTPHALDTQHSIPKLTNWLASSTSSPLWEKTMQKTQKDSPKHSKTLAERLLMHLKNA